MQDAAAVGTGSLVGKLRGMLASRPFLKDVSIMLTGSAGGQAVSLLLSPLLTRLYSPQEFGILSVYSAIIAILVVVASLRYELALPLVRDDEDAVNLMMVCLLTLVGTTAAVGLVSFLAPDRWIERFWPIPLDATHSLIYRTLLVTGYACLGGYFVALYVATRANAYKAIARTRLAQEVEQEVRTHFPELVFETVIPRNIRIGEAPSFGKPVIHHDPHSAGATAYFELAKEVAARG